MDLSLEYELISKNYGTKLIISFETFELSELLKQYKIEFQYVCTFYWYFLPFDMIFPNLTKYFTSVNLFYNQTKKDSVQLNKVYVQIINTH